MQIFSQDNTDIDTAVKLQTDTSRIKTCRACGKLFVTELGRYKCRRKYCNRVHYAICPVCGKEYILNGDDSLREPKKACSKECTGKLIHTSFVKTMQEKYGVDNPSQHPEMHAKALESIKRIQPQMTEHLQQVMQEKYGGMGTSSPVLRAKIENTIQEKYGVRNVSELPEIRKKISDKLKSDECAAKYRTTSQLHYGTDYPAQSDEVQYLMKKTCLERYGVEYVGSLPEVIEKRMSTSLERFGCTSAFSTESSREKARMSMLENCTGRVSKLNKRFGQFLEDNGIKYELEFYLGKKWYDVHLLDTNIVIEIDPSYTHSSIPSHWTTTGMDVNYHLTRTQVAKENSYRCIHVFDWDDWSKLVSILKNPTTRIGARQCRLTVIDKQTADEFIDKYHLQGAVRNTSEAYGLYFNNQLVQVMTFGAPRYTKKHDFELLRLCTHPDYAISGGAEKLFKYFVSLHPGCSIISYCDSAKFSGDVYTRLGFNLDHASAPAKIWSKENKKITDNLLRQRGYDQLFNANYGKGTSNEELMLEHGWLPVYDCGQEVYVLN